MEWSDFGDLAADLVATYAKAKIAAETRPPAPAPAPAPVHPTATPYLPPVAYAAQGSDVSMMLGDILSAPRTWLGLGVIAVLVVVFVKLRR